MTWIACPGCGSTLPGVSIVRLYSWRAREWWRFWAPPIVAVMTGARVSCQAKGCGRHFSIGPTGAFEHDPECYPVSKMPGPAAADVPRETSPVRPARPPMPAWKEPPPV